MAEPSSGENTIDISLSLLSGADSQAAKDLAAALSQTANFFKVFEQSGFKDFTSELSKFTQELKASRQGQVGGASTHASAPPSPTVTPLSASDARRRLAEQPLRGGIRQGLNDAMRGTEGTWRSRFLQQITPQNDLAYDHPGIAGRPIAGAGASTPEGADRFLGLGLGDWTRHITPEESQLSMNTQWGQMGTQQWLQFAARSRGRRAYNLAQQGQAAQAEMADLQSQESLRGGLLGDMPNPFFTEEQAARLNELQTEGTRPEDLIARANREGEKAATRASAADITGEISTFTQNAQRWMGRAQRAASAMNLGQASSLGYERPTGSIGVGGYGFVNPVSALTSPQGREATGALWQSFTEGLRPNISIAESRAIQGELQGQGFSGDTREALMHNVMVPAFQHYGLTPNDMAPFMQSVRTGTTNVGQLNEVIGQLGPAARSAAMSVQETVQQISQVGEQVQGSGGTFMQGAQRGLNFQNATGLPAGLAAQLGENGFVQAQLLRQGYIPGLTTGLASSGTFQNATLAAMTQMMNTTRGTFHNLRGQSLTDPVTGHTVTTEGASAQDQQIAMTANMMGISPDAARRLWHNRHQLQATNVAQTMISQDRRTLDKRDQGYDAYVRHQMGQGNLHPMDKRTYENRAISQKDWSNLEDELYSASRDAHGHVTKQNKERITKILAETDPRKRLQKADQYLAQHNQDKRAEQIKVKFTGMAAKFFEQDLGGGDNRGPVNSALHTANEVANSIGSHLPGPVGEVIKGVTSIL